MRLSIQGCLILLLCFSSFTFAAPSGLSNPYPSEQAAISACEEQQGATNKCRYKDATNSNAPDLIGYAAYTDRGTEYGGRYWVERKECTTLYSHQPDPITGQVPTPGPCKCELGWIDDGEGSIPRCIIDRDQEPEECYENGQIFDPNLGYCVLDCPNGQLNGVCLQDTADNSEDCNADSPDYKGRFGNGNTAFNVCESNTQCEGGSFGAVNGQPTCIPDDYGPPTCPAGGVLVMDEYGFVCDSLQDQPPEEPETPEEPNTDTDDDGQPDEYQKDNDPNINRKQLDELKKSQDDANKSLGKLEQLSKSGNKILKDIEGNTGKSANELKGMGQSLSDIKKNTKDSADNLQDIEDGLSAPSEGYGLGGLLGIPTLSETASQFKSTIMGTSLAQSIDGLTSVPSNTTCPVWTIPKTKFWDAIPMDSHCEAIEAQRGNLGIIFMFFWTGIALFTFWKA